MTKTKTLKCKFVDTIPVQKDEGILYVSYKHDTTTHLCPCGCKNIVPLPISHEGNDFPGSNYDLHRWEFTHLDKIPTIRPSINSVSFECKSHYFITQGKIIWC